MIYANPNGQSPASEDAINKLYMIKHNSIENPYCKECVICFQVYNENEEIIKLNCDERHVYHAECLKKWLRINNTCPICRKPIG